MVLDWLNQPIGGSPTISELIARKKYARAIELLKAQFEGRTPGAQMRLQLADLLVLAGRTQEALPILIGLSDEFAVDRFVAKAVAILKRVDRIEPGRADVQERLALLARQQRAASESVLLPGVTPAAPPAPTRRITFDIEEISHEPGEAPTPVDPETIVVDAAPTTDVAEAWPAVVTDRAPALAEPITTEAQMPTGTLPAVVEPVATEASPIPVTPVVAGDVPPLTGDTAAGPSSESVPAKERKPDVGGRIRGALRRLFSGRGEDAPEAAPAAGVPEAPEVPEAPAPPEATEAAAEVVAPPPVAVEGAGAAPAIDATAEPAAAVVPTPELAEAPPALTPEAATADAPASAAAGDARPAGVSVRMRSVLKRILAALPGSDVAPAAAAAETVAAETAAESRANDAPPEPASAENGEPAISEQAFQDQVLDLVEDLLQRPADVGQAPAASQSTDWLLYREALLATPLFADFSEAEILAVIEGLRLLTFDDGDVIVTEDEPGESLFILVAGQVKVFIRNPEGRNFQVSALREGDFFGEIASMSHRPRSATVVAASRCELLELDRASLDAIARAHPRTREILETQYVKRAGSPDSAAVRSVPLGASPLATFYTQQKAVDVLQAHFGESHWDPRMRLRLADVLVKAGKYDDALPILIGLADDLAREGMPEKAVAILKKIERIQRRDVEELNLAPLARTEAEPAPPEAPAGDARRRKPKTAGFFDRWLLDVVRDAVRPPAPELPRDADPQAVRAYGPGLRASPLFEGFEEEELLAVVRGLRLLVFQPGDVVVTEGEGGQSVFLLASGSVKVFVRSPSGRSVSLCTLGEGAFFGEISALSGRPRSATVTAASRCELLELDRATLEAIARAHPRVQQVLEEHYIARAGSADAASIRTLSFGSRQGWDETR